MSCGGGANAAERGCFSTRLMWRREGDGTVYLYAPYNQADGFCDRPGYHCNFDYGSDISRGAWRFEPNTWYTIEERVKLNTPGQLDGSLFLFVNNALKIELHDLNYREVPDIQIHGIHYSTFFGGSDVTWAPPKDH